METTANQVERTVQAYLDEEREPIENLIRHAFLAGYSAGLAAAKQIYNPTSSPVASSIYGSEAEAAAPELLAALKDCMNMSLFTNPKWDAAIAKAEGRGEHLKAP